MQRPDTCSYYFPALRKEAAEILLPCRGPGTFIIRDGAKEGQHVLSFLGRGNKASISHEVLPDATWSKDLPKFLTKKHLNVTDGFGSNIPIPPSLLSLPLLTMETIAIGDNLHADESGDSSGSTLNADYSLDLKALVSSSRRGTSYLHLLPAELLQLLIKFSQVFSFSISLDPTGNEQLRTFLFLRMCRNLRHLSLPNCSFCDASSALLFCSMLASLRQLHSLELTITPNADALPAALFWKTLFTALTCRPSMACLDFSLSLSRYTLTFASTQALEPTTFVINVSFRYMCSWSQIGSPLLDVCQLSLCSLKIPGDVIDMRQSDVFLGYSLKNLTHLTCGSIFEVRPTLFKNCLSNLRSLNCRGIIFSSSRVYLTSHPYLWNPSCVQIQG